MKKHGRTFILLASLATTSVSYAASLPFVPGEWETTSHFNTPQGAQVIHVKGCRQGDGVSALLMRQQGEQCAPWQETSSGVDGAHMLRSTCTQRGPVPGGLLTFHVQATVTVAPNGRSAHGTVQAAGEINGMSFTSPPTQFTSRFIGTCPGR
jgi:hypothetical protein